jgi:hypothetical protein
MIATGIRIPLKGVELGGELNIPESAGALSCSRMPAAAAEPVSVLTIDTKPVSVLTIDTNPALG